MKAGRALLLLFRRDGLWLHRESGSVWRLWCFAPECRGERMRGTQPTPTLVLDVDGGAAVCSRCGMEASAVEYLHRVDRRTMSEALARVAGSESAFYAFVKGSRLHRML